MPLEPYAVDLTVAVDKELGKKKLRPHRSAIEAELLILGDDPTAGELLAGTLRGVRSLHVTLPGSGEFRAAYVVLEAERVVLVFLVAPRENFYRKAQRRYAALLGRPSH